MQEGRFKTALKGFRNSAESALTRATGNPPRRIRKGISPLWFDFRRTGLDQLDFFIELAALRPEDHVLDIGCGVGRIALPLTRYLASSGSYDGFDILPYMIEWCQQNISLKHPKFCLHLGEIDSSTNTLAGGQDASEYTFPFAEETVDLAYAGSLFTHLTPAGTENYLTESARTLRVGGRLVATFNMYNAQSLELVPGKSLAAAWPNDHGTYRTKEKDHPESNVAYDESYVRE